MARTQQIEPILIRCDEVRPGMFPDERFVTVRAYDGEPFPMFADFRILCERENHTYIVATRMSIDIAEGVSNCLLPVEGTETPSTTRWVLVDNGKIIER